MSDTRVVITGASSGIGQATARLCAQCGWKVVAVARREDRLRELAQETGAEMFVADITQQSDVDALKEYLASTGDVHALVNNAGGAFGAHSVEEADLEQWQRMFDVNVFGFQRVTAAMLPMLRDSARTRGHADIMTVTSTAGFIPYEGGGGYNAAKYAEHALVGVLRLELAGEPIRVMEIAPGLVKTDEFALNRLGDKEKAQAVYQGVEQPLVAEDIAEAIVHALELPGHVNMDLITIRPVAQAAQHKLIREPLSPKG